MSRALFSLFNLMRVHFDANPDHYDTDLQIRNNTHLDLLCKKVSSCTLTTSVSDPDPDSGVFWIHNRIRNPEPDPGAKKD